eukprot:295911-Chlamydomonas_euryale.AAC.1
MTTCLGVGGTITGARWPRGQAVRARIAQCRLCTPRAQRLDASLRPSIRSCVRSLSKKCFLWSSIIPRARSGRVVASRTWPDG